MVFSWKRVDLDEKQGRGFSQWGRWDTGIGFPEQLCLPHHWKFPRPGWMWLEQPEILEGVPTHGMKETLKGPCNPNFFYDSLLLVLSVDWDAHSDQFYSMWFRLRLQTWGRNRGCCWAQNAVHSRASSVSSWITHPASQGMPRKLCGCPVGRAELICLQIPVDTKCT